MSDKKVSVLILNYNGKKYLKNCLDSVISQSYNNFEIVLFDNASADASVSFVKENYSDRVKLVESKINLGFAGGNNEGVKHCSGEFIILLNNDTTVDKNCISELIDTFNKVSNPGIIQSLVLTEGISMKYYEMNGTINLLGHNIMREFRIEKDGVGKILLATGAAMMFKKELINELGELFPDEYFFYAEDTYFSLRTILAGFNNYHTSNSVVNHVGSGSLEKKKNSFVTFCQERNRLLNFLLLFSSKFLWKYYPYIFFNFFLKLARSIVDKKYSFRGLLKAYGWIFSNTGWIRNKRSILPRYNSKQERCVLELISGKIFNGDNILEKFVNSLSILYCRIVSLKVLELNK